MTVREAMTTGIHTIGPDEPVMAAASTMAAEDIGDVVVARNGDLIGILTDRDIVIRVVAEGRDPETTTVGEVCSPEPVVIDAESTLDEARELMREHDIRRLPVVDGGEPIGFVTLADVAEAEEPASTLADIAAAEPDS